VKIDESYYDDIGKLGKKTDRYLEVAGAFCIVAESFLLLDKLVFSKSKNCILGADISKIDAQGWIFTSCGTLLI
jgi:hypothetical protein